MAELETQLAEDWSSVALLESHRAAREDLEALLSALGRNLASQCVVDLPLPPGLGSEVDFRLRVRATGGVGEYHNDRFFIPQQAGPATAPLPAELPRAPAAPRAQ